MRYAYAWHVPDVDTSPITPEMPVPLPEDIHYATSGIGADAAVAVAYDDGVATPAVAMAMLKYSTATRYFDDTFDASFE